MIAVVKKDKDMVLAEIIKMSKRLNGKEVKEEIEVQYFDEKRTKEKNPKTFVIFYNNIQGTPDLNQGE